MYKIQVPSTFYTLQMPYFLLHHAIVLVFSLKFFVHRSTRKSRFLTSRRRFPRPRRTTFVHTVVHEDQWFVRRNLM